MKRVLTAMRLILGGVMALSGLNYFLGVVPVPVFADPLAAQLMGAFEHSGLLAVGEGMKLVAGILLLAGVFVPFALAVLLPILTCVLYVTLLLEADPVVALATLVLLAINGLLMLVHLPYYREMLRPGALAMGETRDANYGELYAKPFSPVPRQLMAASIAVLLAAIAFYYWIVPFASGDMGLLVLIFPAVVLLAGTTRTLTKRA
jgi:hypothetical protein